MDRTLARLSRRGPDGRGLRTTPHALLGHTRLAIQDLSASAAQPMSTPDGALAIIYNGEIYNAPALRIELQRQGVVFRTRSDTEVLLHAIDTWGHIAALERIRGMFSFAAIRTTQAGVQVLAAVDPAGMKPLVWSFIDNPDTRGEKLLLIASDCDALRLLAPTPPRVNIHALRHMLGIGYIPAPHTAWQNTHKLAPGTMLEWSGRAADSPIISAYWQPPSAINLAQRESDFAPLLEQLAAEHLLGDVPVGMFLSAGLDSISIALALHASGANMSRIAAFSLGTGDARDETADAAAIAHALGMPHHIVPFASGDLLPTLERAAERYDEPQGFTAVLSATRVAEAMREHAPEAKVVLTGDGGDESLGGYAWHRDSPAHPLALTRFTEPSQQTLAAHDAISARVARPDATDAERQRAIIALGDLSFVHRSLARAFGGFHPAEADALIAGQDRAADAPDFDATLAAQDVASLPMPRRSQRLDVLGFCAGSIQPKLDRACMGVGLELRAPYLDRRMIEWGISRPVDPSELTPAGGKPSIRAYLARAIARGTLPAHILARPKQGFSLRLRDEAFEPLIETIARSRLIPDCILAPDWPAYLTKNPEMRRTRLFILAMLAKWYDARC